MRQAAVVFCVALGIGAAIWALGRSHATAFYTKELVDMRAEEHVTTNDGVLRIAHDTLGTVPGGVRPPFEALRLAYAKTVIRRSPILALAGTDPSQLESAINTLITARESLSHAQENPDDAELIDALYPISFLSAAAEVERARLTFLEQGDSASLGDYEKLLVNALRRYKEDLVAFRTTFENAVPEDAPDFIWGSDRAERSTMLATLRALESEIRTTKRAVRAQRLCIAGWTFFCNTNIPLPPVSPAPTLNESVSVTDISSTIESIYAAGTPLEDERSLIKIRMAKGACTRDWPGASLFALVSKKYDHVPDSLYPQYLGDVRLIDSTERSDLPFYSYFAERGLRYVPSPGIVHYACGRIADEFARLLSVRAIAEFAHLSPLSTHSADVEVQELEKRLAREPISEADALAYLEKARVSFEQLPEDMKNEVVTLLVQTQNNSSEFDEIVRFIALIEMRIGEAAARGAPGGFDVATVFYARSAFLSLFLVNNPSVVPENPRLFASNSVPIDKQPFLFFSQLPQTPAILQMITEGQQIFNAVHARPL